MDAQTVIDEWDTSPFDGGFDALHDLQSRRFSGAVQSAGTWAFFREGELLAVIDDLSGDPRPGEFDAFDGGGRIHEASHPPTATLAAMLGSEGEVRGQYFTEDTPLTTVHETLADGGFTGYVELSENVLSGDYYVVYDDGEGAYLGVLGSSQRLISGEEAQSKIEGEVGIYSVVAVQFPEVGIPASEPSGVDATGGGVASGAAETADGPTDATQDEDSTADADPDRDSGSSGEREPSPDTSSAGVEERPADVVESAPDSETSSGPEFEHGSQSESGSRSETGSSSAPQESPDTDPESPSTSIGQDGLVTDPRSEPESERSAGSETERGLETEASGRHRSDRRDDGYGVASDPDGDDANAGQDGVSGVTVPSLDPERTGGGTSARAEGHVRNPGSRAGSADRVPGGDSQSEADPDEDDGDRAAVVRDEYEDRIEELRTELESVHQERDRLRERVSQLESSGSETATGVESSLSPSRALSETSLFVREGTRGGATMEDAHAGRTDRETLAENLRLEYHSQFDDGGAMVEGEPFESWLRSSPPYDFVEWLILELPFEIRSTGSTAELQHLYDAIPEIDRVGFGEDVAVGDESEGREISFDVVAWNRMGEPLVAADIDGGRDPTRDDALRPLVGDGEDVCEDHETLAATVSVTSSYFEPDALDAAREATSGSLLSREKYRSYLKLSRKNGFHLCLVEAREGTFHLTVPEL